MHTYTYIYIYTLMYIVISGPLIFGAAYDGAACFIGMLRLGVVIGDYNSDSNINSSNVSSSSSSNSHSTSNRNSNIIRSRGMIKMTTPK